MVADPDLPYVDEAESILADLDETEDALTALRESLRRLPSRIAARLESGDTKIAVARYLYWHVTEIPAKALAEDLVGCNVHELPALIGPASVNLQCDRCGTQMQVTSRSSLQETMRAVRHDRPKWAEGYKLLCKLCREAVMAERTAQYREAERERAVRQAQLRAMPYGEYLQTPEWRERRERQLKSTGYRCQVCNSATPPLDVHHRSYVRRGGEYFKDLIVLCRTCHGTFHQEGRLARE